MGRKSTYSALIADQICARIAEGETLQAICRDSGMPKWRTVYDWMDAHEAFAANIALARDIGFDAIAEGTIAIIDAAPERGADGKIDPGWVQHQKLRAEHRLKLLAKWSPKKYGERMNLEHSGKVGLEALIAPDED